MAERLRPALFLQMLHIVFSMLWNIVGVSRNSQGLVAPGPTASVLTVMILLGLGGSIVLGSRRWVWLYIAASLVVAVGAASAVGPAFYKDPSLWLSEQWRIGGVVLNTFGVVGASWGIWICLQHRKS